MASRRQRMNVLSAAAVLLLLQPASLMAQSSGPSPATSEAAAATESAPEPRVLWRFDGVDWSGIDDESLLANVKTKVSLARLKRGTSIRPERFDYLLRRLPRELHEALQPFGYYNAEAALDVQRGDSAVALKAAVTLNQTVRIRRSDIEMLGPAKNDRALRVAVKSFKPAIGQPLRHADYEISKATIQRLLTERGYFASELLEARVEVQRALDVADMRLRWNSGPRFRFGDVNVIGSQLKPGLLQPLVPFRAQQRFDQRQLLELQRRLSELDYFDRIEVNVRDRPEGQTLDGQDGPPIGVDVLLTPAPRNVYRAGASYGTDTGAAIKLGYDRRWLNAAGHKWNSDLLLGEQRSAASFRYRIPAFERFRGWWVLSTDLRQEPFGTFDPSIYEAAVSRELNWRGNSIVAGLHARREDRDSEGDLLIYPQLTVERKVMDDPLYPSRGFAWRVTGRWGLNPLGSDVGFRQLIANAAVVRSISSQDRLILRGEYGQTSIGDFDRMPLSFRFFAGGDRSIRGYGYQELSPRDADDKRIGAPKLATGSIEWEHMFSAEWGGALFVDGGNVFDQKLDPVTGVGLGLRWRSPVGPVRVDFARGLDEPDHSFRLHFTLGPDL